MYTVEFFTYRLQVHGIQKNSEEDRQTTAKHFFLSKTIKFTSGQASSLSGSQSVGRHPK